MQLPPLVTADELDLHFDLKCDADRAAIAVRRGSNAVRAYVGRPLTEVVDDLATFTYGQAAWLPYGPVTDISAVTVDGVTSEFTVQRSANALRVIPTTAGTKITVTYTHGYKPDDHRLAIAADIALRCAGRIYTNPQDKSSNSVALQSGSWAASTDPRMLTSDEKLLLNPLRSPRLVGTVRLGLGGG